MVTIRSSTARMRAMTSNMRTARSLSTRALALRVLGRGLATFLLPSDMVAILGGGSAREKGAFRGRAAPSLRSVGLAGNTRRHPRLWMPPLRAGQDWPPDSFSRRAARASSEARVPVAAAPGLELDVTAPDPGVACREPPVRLPRPHRGVLEPP